MGKQRKAEQKPAQKPGTTNQDVVIHLIDTFYNLINSGNFIGVVILFFIFLIAWRLTPGDLNTHVTTIFNVLTSGKYLYFVLSVTLGVSLAGNFIQRKMYKKEIRRLTHLRKKLMHGRKDGSLELLENHNPSDYDIDNGD